MPRRSIPQFDRVRIVTLCQEGLSTREVSRRLRVNQSDVVRTWRRYRDTGTVDDMPRSGRPRATTVVDDRYLRIAARRNPDSNATMLNNAFRSATGRRVSTQTVRNRLHDAQLYSRRPWRGPALQPRHHAARYRWAQQHAEWTPQNWHHVLFTDECRICLQPDNRRRRVWRHPGQAERLRNTVQRVQQGGGSLMFWGGIMWGRRTPLVVMEGAVSALRYMNDILRPIVQPYRQHIGEAFVFMDDNSRPHRAHLVNEFLQDNDIARLEWPACSPDMNPIEHAWDMLKRAVYGRIDPPTTLRDLRRIVVEEWDNLDQQCLDELVDSMPRRIQACINARGRATGY